MNIEGDRTVESFAASLTISTISMCRSIDYSFSLYLSRSLGALVLPASVCKRRTSRSKLVVHTLHGDVFFGGDRDTVTDHPLHVTV